MEEKNNSSKNFFISSLKIVGFSGIILFATIKLVLILFGPRNPTKSDGKIKTAETAKTETHVVTATNDSQKNIIVEYKKQNSILKQQNKELRASVSVEVDPKNNSSHPTRQLASTIKKNKKNDVKPQDTGNGKDDKAASKEQKQVDNSKAGNSPEGKKPSSGAKSDNGKVGSDATQKHGSAIQKTSDPITKPADPPQKSPDPIQKPVDLTQKKEIKDNQVPVQADEIKSHQQNKDENPKPSTDQKEVEFVNKSGKVAINPNNAEVSDVPIREKASEASTLLGQFSFFCR